MAKRAASPQRNCSSAKKKKYSNKFNSDWLKDLDWVSKSDKGDTYAYCKVCTSHISVLNGGRSDLTRHAQSNNHLKFTKAKATSSSMQSFFTSNKTLELTTKVTRAETMFANFIAEHNLPFTIADHFTKLSKEMFPDSEVAKKFASGRMKSTMIIKKAIAPELDIYVTALCKERHFSLLIDESNDQGGDKELVILVRVYDKEIGRVVTRFLDIPVCNDGAAAAIFTTVDSVFSARGIPWKHVLAFMSDNCNVMKGRYNSVMSRIKEVQPKVLDIGCVCHLANLCTVHAVKQIPMPVEDLLIDIYYHFYHSCKRKEMYKQFQDFCDVEPMKILKHASTRWLSLQRCIARTLQQWPALQSYFTSHDEVEKNGRVKRCADYLSNPVMKLYFFYLDFILIPLNEFNTVFQTEETQTGHLIPEMNRLLRKFLAKFVTMKEIKASASDLTKVPYKDTSKHLDDSYLAVGPKARTYLVDNQENFANGDEKKFFTAVRKFYIAAVEKMIQKFPFHDTILNDLQVLNPDKHLRVDHSPSSLIKLAEHFSLIEDEQTAQLEEEFTDYQLCDDHELPKYVKTETRIDEFWAGVGKIKTASGRQRFPLLSYVVPELLAIAHSNADSERIFSMCRKIHTEQRSELNNDTKRALLSSKINRDEHCYQFKPSVPSLKSAKSVTWDYIRDHH